MRDIYFYTSSRVGVTIGDGTVIEAGSVVTKDIPENCLAVGNPCRVMREINIGSKGQSD